MKQLKITLTVLMVAALVGMTHPSFAQNSTDNDANRSAMSHDRDRDADRHEDHDHGNWGLLGLLGLAGLAGLRKKDEPHRYTTTNPGTTGRTGV